MNGDEVLSQIRKKKEFADIPVVVLTNMNIEAVENKFVALDVSGFLLKSELTPKQVVEFTQNVIKTHEKS
jgi:CheY-like chemotaxis protein